MQVPTSFKGLKFSLKSLGFEGAAEGLDVSQPNAKQMVVDHINWQAEADPNGMALRRKKAMDLVNLFDWASVVRAGHKEILAPEGAETEVFTKPKKTGKKTYIIHSPDRSIELAAEADDLADSVSSRALPVAVKEAVEVAASLLSRP